MIPCSYGISVPVEAWEKIVIKPKTTKKPKVAPACHPMSNPPDSDRAVLLMVPPLSGPDAGSVFPILARYRRHARSGKGAWVSVYGGEAFPNEGYEDQTVFAMAHWAEISPEMALALEATKDAYQRYVAKVGFHVGGAPAWARWN